MLHGSICCKIFTDFYEIRRIHLIFLCQYFKMNTNWTEATLVFFIVLTSSPPLRKIMLKWILFEVVWYVFMEITLIYFSSYQNLILLFDHVNIKSNIFNCVVFKIHFKRLLFPHVCRYRVNCNLIFSYLFFSIVYPNARVVWSVPLHGCLLTQRHTG